MKYFLAVLACVGLYIAYAFISAIMGWKSGGGAIPIMILLAAMVGTWRAITKRGSPE